MLLHFLNQSLQKVKEMYEKEASGNKFEVRDLYWLCDRWSPLRTQKLPEKIGFKETENMKGIDFPFDLNFDSLPKAGYHRDPNDSKDKAEDSPSLVENVICDAEDAHLKVFYFYKSSWQTFEETKNKMIPKEAMENVKEKESIK